MAIRDDSTPRRWALGVVLGLLGLALAASLCLPSNSRASAVPGPVRLIYGTGEIVPIPAAIPHEEGDMVDRRIVPDLRWIAKRFPIYVSDGYSGPLPNGEHAGCHGCHVRHSDHYNGLAVDIVPLSWSGRCDSHWRGITRLAKLAEPRQNRPRPPFRWVGYDGDAGHGCGDHLHISWEHAPAPQFQLAEWVSVFPAGMGAGIPPTTPPAPTPPPTAKEPTPPPAPSGGISTVRGGGISPRGD
ncbi:MAG TPA: hypothetical protein VF176_03450 [Solirubrobacterales bacterium]